jgi:hypothetical protein
MSPPILSTEFEPFGWPDGWSAQNVMSMSMTPEIRNLGTGFFTSENASALDSWYRELLTDLVLCVRVSRHASELPDRSLEHVNERWIYLKVQALSYRLLARTDLAGIQEALRIATLLWILSITDYVGAALTALLLLPKLQAAFEKASIEAQSTLRLFPGLYFWMSGLGALVALSASKNLPPDSLSPESVPYSQEVNFFSLRMAQTARQLGLDTTFVAFRRTLQTYLYLDINGGVEACDLISLVDAASRMDQSAL